MLRQSDVWVGMWDLVRHAGGVGTYLVVDAAALLRGRGKAASHGEMRLLHHDRWWSAGMVKRCRRVDGRCPFGEGSTPSVCVLVAPMQDRRNHAWRVLFSACFSSAYNLVIVAVFRVELDFLLQRVLDIQKKLPVVIGYFIQDAKILQRIKIIERAIMWVGCGLSQIHIQRL